MRRFGHDELLYKYKCDAQKKKVLSVGQVKMSELIIRWRFAIINPRPKRASRASQPPAMSQRQLISKLHRVIGD